MPKGGAVIQVGLSTADRSGQLFEEAAGGRVSAAERSSGQHPSWELCTCGPPSRAAGRAVSSTCTKASRLQKTELTCLTPSHPESLQLAKTHVGARRA